MTRWPLCVAEIALYAVIAGLLIAFVLDARQRWREHLEDQDPDEHGGPSERDDDAEITAVRPTRDGAPHDRKPPPLAS